MANALTGMWLDPELERLGGPASSWNDEERDKWRAEMQAANAEMAARQLIDVPDAVDWADRSVQAERHGAQDPFEAALDAEFERMKEHCPRPRTARRCASEAEEFDRRCDLRAATCPTGPASFTSAADDRPRRRVRET